MKKFWKTIRPAFTEKIKAKLKMILIENEDDISRPLPGKKDCVIQQDGQKVKVQKRLVLRNLKELYRKSY